jgi:hypothetical protein
VKNALEVADVGSSVAAVDGLLKKAFLDEFLEDAGA